MLLLSVTFPKLPFPMTFSKSKSCTPIFFVWPFSGALPPLIDCLMAWIQLSLSCSESAAKKYVRLGVATSNMFFFFFLALVVT